MKRALLFLTVAIILAIATGAKPAHALILTNDQQPNGLSYQDILKASGLNNQDIQSVCEADKTINALNGVINNLGDSIKSAVADGVKTIFSSLIKSLVDCAMTNFTYPEIEGNFPGHLPTATCSFSVASDTAIQALAQKAQDYKANFLASCASAVSLARVEDLVHQALQSQGPGGGTAWVSDYVSNLFVTPDLMAQRRMWSILANTTICPYFKDAALNYFRVPQSERLNPTNIGGNGLAVNGDDPFQLRAACTAPSDFVPDASDAATFNKMGGFDLLPIINEPQNNLPGFIAMAQDELDTQVAAMRAQGAAMSNGGSGGFLPFTDSCLKNSQGLCLTIGTIVQPAGGVESAETTLNLAEQISVVNTNGLQNQAVIDMASRVSARIMDLTNQPLPFTIEFGPQADPKNFTPVPTPTPDPNDAACVGGNPLCHCIKTSNAALQMAQGLIKPAIDKALQQNAALFASSDGQIQPGQRRAVLQAICDNINPPQGGGRLCVPHPLQDDEVVIVGAPQTYSFDVIIDSGTCPIGCVNTSGGIPIASCDPGVQDGL